MTHTYQDYTRNKSKTSCDANIKIIADGKEYQITAYTVNDAIGRLMKDNPGLCFNDLEIYFRDRFAESTRRSVAAFLSRLSRTNLKDLPWVLLHKKPQ